MLRLAFLGISFTIALCGQAVAQPPSTNPLVRTADSLFAAKDFAGAMALYEKLANAEPAVARHWMRLGYSAHQGKQLDRAAAAFERAASIAPPNPAAPYNAGAMHALMGHADKAFAWLDSAITIGGITPQLLDGDGDLASLRQDPRYAQTMAKARKRTTPCLDDPERRKFDFWVGEWDVKNAAGNAAGTSIVEIVSGGCALLENWTDAGGGTGKSLNTWNRNTQRWQQFWVGQGGDVQDYRTSVWRDSSLVFMTETFQSPQGPVMIRLTFTPQSGGVVRQFFERSADGGSTWVPSTELFYHRKTR